MRKYVVISDFGDEQTLLGYAATMKGALIVAREAAVVTAVVYRISDGTVVYTH